MSITNNNYDLLVVGSGIVGLAHAYEAVKRGLKVGVVEQNAHCTGASIRNFGFITISGQGARDTWRRAVHSAKVWKELAELAKIKILHHGTWILCEREEAVDVANAFIKTNMGTECQFFSKAYYPNLLSLGHSHLNSLNLKNSLGLLYSPHEFRLESKEAIPQLVNFLENEMGVDFFWGTEVFSVENSTVHTSNNRFDAQKVVICSGAQLTGVAKPYLEKYDLQLCTLQMLRIKVQEGFILPGSVMTDNSLARYLGWSELPEAKALQERIAMEMPEYLQEGIHLIVVQSADGTLVVGDSHRYGVAEDVFACNKVENLIIQLMYRVLNITEHTVVERWTGVYPSSHIYDALIERVSSQIRVAVVTSGTGASTAFGLAKDNFDDWGLGNDKNSY
jgi:FAD dependent oxidoreductase TIGR03364